MVKNLMLFFALCAPFVLCAQEKLESAEQFVDNLENKIPQLLHDFSVPGAAIVIIENGEIVLQKGFGFSDMEKAVKVTTKTGFNIASISKTVAAWGVMKLVQDGKIDLEAPAEKYLTRWHLPKSEFNSNGVTIRRLLSHTAGLSLHGYPGWSPSDTLPTIEESLNGKNNGPGRVEIILDPGMKYKYSGGGYTILQLIIEEVTGQKFEDYMQSQILNPLGMRNSSYKIDSKIMAASASEYNNLGEKIDFELFTAQAAAGLHTTIEDFTRFAFANLYRNNSWKKAPPVLSAEIIQQMMEPVPAAKGGYAYGLGYEVDKHKNLKGLSGHNGSNSGWQSMFRVDPVTNDGFIVFTNGGAGHNIINVVLCEWISWRTGESMWEGCHLKLPVANKMKQIIEDKGIEHIATTYKELKKNQPEKYNFSEDQLNQLGYHYLSKGDLEKTVAIFKLNVEVFPHAFNVYDSYGEALLAKGARADAIENYIKSVELNPGNENGIKVLKELGISAAEIAKRISVTVDPQVLAGYVGRYQTSTGEIVTISNSEGQLSAVMQEQRFNLIAQSTSRFRPLGEDLNITFFTAATGKKGLWANQRIWSKLPNMSDNPTEQASSVGKFLVFRNKPSWGRQTDFENVLAEIGCNYEQRESGTMADIELSHYEVIIIPGAQNPDYYNDYVDNIERFDEYVAKGGILILELNGAEKNKSIQLPLGVTIAPHNAFENAILEPDHPIFFPLSGKHLIQARYASSGYLQQVPDDALILAVEADATGTFTDRPTFIEYSYAKGRVIAANQCFHDRDGSGRGPLMESLISYALTKI